MLYFADVKWWRWHKDKPEFKAFAGDKVTIQNTAAEVDDPGIYMLRNGGQDGLSDQAEALRTGTNSGYQALNLAILAGAKRIVLLGYDMRAEDARRSHFFGDHPDPTPVGVFPTMAAHYRKVAPLIAKKGIEVINCTPGSALTCFRASTLQEALAGDEG